MVARMASTAAPSAAFLSPRPTQRLAERAAASVTRTSSSARLRSGVCELMGPKPTSCTLEPVNATTTSPLDIAALRRRFPALSRSVDGRPAAFLDGPGGSQTPDAVIDAMTAYLRGSNANLGGAFVTSAESDALYERARQAGADFTGSRPEEIAFGANMTTLNFLLAHAVARTLKEGDEIIVTQLDHDGNVSPWLRIADDHALTVHTVPVRPDDVTLDIDALEALLSDRTKIVAFTLASNAVGSKPDARRISDLAHSVGALAWADAVHYAPHGRIDRVGMGLDVVRLLAVQVLRPAPRSRRDPPRPGRALAGRPRAARRRDARRPPLRDGHAVARGAGRLRRRRRVPGRAGGGREPEGAARLGVLAHQRATRSRCRRMR